MPEAAASKPFQISKAIKELRNAQGERRLLKMAQEAKYRSYANSFLMRTSSVGKTEIESGCLMSVKVDGNENQDFVDSVLSIFRKVNSSFSAEKKYLTISTKFLCKYLSPLDRKYPAELHTCNQGLFQIIS